ncbi:MAG: AMP-binding protein [Steroidobacteraceae bacterium]
MPPTASNLSHVAGSTAVPLQHRTVGQALAATVDRWPDRTALIVGEQSVRWSFREFSDRTSRLAAAFLASGLRPGDRVGIWAPNCAEWVLTQFATAQAGLVLVNINPAYRTSELRFALRKTGCRMLLLADAFKSSDYLAMMREIVPELELERGMLLSEEFPDLKEIVNLGEAREPGFLPFGELVERGSDANLDELERISAALSPDDPINIQFTSGTTGTPKGATLTHYNLVNNGFFVGEGLRLTEADKVCIPVPMYHCFGMVLGVMAAVTHGAASVFPCPSFEAERVLRCVQDERCTALHGVPTMFIAELEHPRFAQFDLSSLRTGIMAGAPCPIAVMRRVVEQMHMREVTICYGMTETSPVSFQSNTDDPLERRVSTVGRIHPHVEVKIVDADGRTVPRGTSGELCTRGYSVMRGYWDEPQRTAEAVDREGWMHTGDLAVIDADGYCNIVGRVKDMIIRGGENVYPREIEEFLIKHPKVLDVAVVGVPDARFGEAVCAVLRVREGLTCSEVEIQEYCTGQIAHYKVPRYVRFVDEFPMTVTGKVQKFLIRESVARELGLSSEATA